MPNKVVETYRKFLAQTGQSDPRDDYLITAELGEWAEQRQPDLFKQFEDFDAEYREIREANSPGTFGGIKNTAKTAFDRSVQALNVAGGIDEEDAADIADREVRIQDRPASVPWTDWQRSEGMDAVRTFLRDPIEITSNIVASGFAGSVPSLAAGVGLGAAGALANPVAGVAGAAAGTGAGSLAVEYGNKYLEVLREAGADLTDPESILRVVSDPEVEARAKELGLRRGLPVAAFDAVSAGLAGKFLKGLRGATTGATLRRGAAEAALQGGLGGGGEIAGALSAGDEISPKAVFEEVVGELGPAVIETGAAGLRREMAGRALRPAAAPAMPSVMPSPSVAPIQPPTPTAEPEIAAPAAVPLSRQVVLMTDDAQKQAVFDSLTAKRAGGVALTPDEAAALDILTADGFVPAIDSKVASGEGNDTNIRESITTGEPPSALPAATATAGPLPGLILPTETTPPVAAGAPLPAVAGDTGVATGTQPPGATTPAAAGPSEIAEAPQIQPQILAPARVSPDAAPSATYQYAVFEPDMVDAQGRRVVQVDTLQGAENTASTTLDALRAQGVTLPEPPTWLPAGRYTPEQVQAAIDQGPPTVAAAAPTPISAEPPTDAAQVVPVAGAAGVEAPSNTTLEANLRAALTAKPEPFVFGPVAEGAENVVDYRAKPEFANLAPEQWEAVLPAIKGLREGEKPNIARTRTAMVLRAPDGRIVQAGLLPPSTAKTTGGETATGFRLQKMGTQTGVGSGAGVRVRVNPGGKTTVLLRDVLAAGYTPVARLTFRDEPGKIFQQFDNEAAYNAAAELSGVAPVPEAVPATPEERLAEIDQEAARLEEQALQAEPAERARIEEQMEALAGEYRGLGGEPQFMSTLAEPPLPIQASQMQALAIATARLRQMGARVDLFTKAFFQASLGQQLQRRLDMLINTFPITPEEEMPQLQAAIENLQRQIESTERIRGVTYNANHIALGLSDVQNASMADLVVLLHEASHLLLRRATPQQQGAVMRAVNATMAEMQARHAERQGRTGVIEGHLDDGEELLVSSLAQKLALEGVPDSPSLARALWQWVKDLYFRAAMGVQAAFGVEPNPQMALDWFENQVRRVVGGDYDYRFASIVDRFAPETMAAQVARVSPMEGPLNQMTDRYDAMTESLRQPDAMDDTQAGVEWNFRFFTEGGVNPGEELDIPATEAQARIRAAAVNEEKALAEAAYTEAMAGLPEGAERTTFDQWWTLVAGARETPQARLEEMARRSPGAETARIGGERMTKAMNDLARVRAKALVKAWDAAVARLNANAEESIASAETNLTAAAKLANKIEGNLRNADMHNATLTDKLNELVDGMRKGLRRGRDAVKLGPLAAAIRQADNLGPGDAIPDAYVRVFKAVRDGEVRIFDYVQSIAKMDLPLADLSVAEVIAAIRAEAPGDNLLAQLIEPRNKPLLVALSTLAQRNAEQLDFIQLRLADAETFLKIKGELDTIRRAQEAELGQIEKSFREGTKATVYADRIKQRMVAQRRKLRRYQATIRQAEERRQTLAKLRPVLTAKIDEIETNGLPHFSEWRPSDGAVYPAMTQDAVGKWRRKDQTLRFKADGGAVDPAQIHADLASNRQYLEANRERQGSQLYQLVQKATDEIGAIDTQQKYFELKRNWYEKWFLPAADTLVSGGGAGAAEARRQMNRFQSILFRNWGQDIEVPSIRWTAAAREAMKAAGMNDQRAFLDQVYDPVIYHLGVNPGLEEGPALREAVRAARRRLTTVPNERFDEAFKAFMRQTKAMSDTFVRIAEENGVFVEDDKLGGELRRAVARGWLTVMRRMDAGTVTTVLRDMEKAGWKLEFQDSKSGARSTPGFDAGVTTKQRVVGATTFDPLLPWLTTDEQEAAARKAVLENPETFSQAISGFFTPGVVQRFLEPYVNKPGEPIFGYRGEDIDQLDVQQAWQDAGGNVARWIDLLGERVGLSEETVNLDGEEVPQIELDSDLSPQAEWRTIMLRRIDALYKMTAGMAADANQTQSLFDPSGRPPLVLMTDRDNDLLPAEFVQHATFGSDDSRSLLATIAFHAAFGRNGASMVKAINEMKGNLEARKAQFDLLASRRSTKVARKALAKEMGIDYQEAQRAAAIYADVENGLDILKAQFGFGNAAGVMGDVRGGLALVHFMASQITNQPKTGLLNMLQPAQRAIARRSLGPVMVRDTVSAFGGTAYTLLGQFLESFGLNLLHSSQHAKDIGAMQGVGFGQISNAELLGLGVGRRGDERNPVARAAATFQGMQRRGGFGRAKEFPRAPNVPVLTNVMHGLGLDVAIANGVAEARSVEGLVQGAVNYFAAHPENAANPTFRLTAKDIGGIWGFDAASFDYMRRKLAENGFGSLESLVRQAMERQARGEPVLTKEEVAKVAMISNNDLDLMANINTRPGWWAQNPVMRLFTPLLGWPIAQMNTIHQAMRTVEGRGSYLQALKTIGIMAAWALPVGLAFTFLTDYYDDKVLKKKSALGNVDPLAAIPVVGPALALATSDLDPMQQITAMGQRLSRAGNVYGLGADFFSSILTGFDETSGQRPFSLDSRVLAFSQLTNLMQVMTNWAKSGFTTTYGNVERPLIMALGGNGAIQAMATFNAALGLENQEARITARTNAQQWLRVAAREAGVELRRGGGGSVAPTPTSVWVREMYLAALGNDRLDFLDAYRNAVSAAREAGEADPEKKVLESWRSRSPLSVLRTKPDEQQLRQLYSTMDDSGREAVQSALRLYGQFTEMIAPTEMERWQTRQEAAMRGQMTRGMNLRQQMSGAALFSR